MVGALRLQALEEAAAPAADGGAAPPDGTGRERRRRRRGRRPGDRVQGRVAQPPERGRAVPGRGHRRRRDPARHLRGGRAADRGARLAALRRARLAALALPVRLRREGHRPLRQLDRRGDRRRRGLLRAGLRAELPGQRDVRRARAARAADPERRGRGRQPRSCCSARSPAATGSAARRCWRARSCPTRTSRSARPCRSATRSRRRSWSSAASSCSTATCWRRCRTWARPGLSSSSSEMASKGEVGLDIDVSRGAAARGRHGAVRDHDLGVAGADAVRGRAGAARRGARRSASAGRCARRRSARSRTRSACACSTATSWSATCRSTRSSTTARCTTSSPRSRPSRSTRTPPPRLGAGAARRRDAARAARLAQHRVEALGLRAVRLDRRLAHGAAPGAGRRRGAPARARRRLRARSRSRSTATAGAWPAIPYTGAVEAVLECARNLACVGRRAARPHQLPQLRQPREAAHRVAAHARGRGPARRLPRARRAGGRRQRLALQRGRRGADLPDADRRHGRQAAGPGRRVPRRGFAEEGHAVALVGMFEPALEGSELEKLRGRLSGALPPLDLAAHADALVRVREAVRSGATRRRRTTSPRAGWRARSPSAASRADLGASVDGRRRATPTLFGEGPGGVVVAGPRDAIEALDAAIVIGEVGGETLRDRGRPQRCPVQRACAGAYEDAIRLGVRRLGRCYPRTLSAR